MAAEPIVARAVAFALVPGEDIVHLDQGLHRHVGGAPDAERRASAIDHHDMLADGGHGRTTGAEVPQQANGGALRAIDHQVAELVGHGRAVAESEDVVAVVIQSGAHPIGGPEGANMWCSVAHVSAPLEGCFSQAHHAGRCGGGKYFENLFSAKQPPDDSWGGMTLYA